MTKKCSVCKVEKPLTDFHRDNSRPDRRTYECKACMKEYARQYYQRNRDKVREQIARYYQKATGSWQSRQFTIYKITFYEQYVYVGCTSQRIEDRLGVHQSPTNTCATKPFFMNNVAFDLEVVAKYSSAELASARETREISVVKEDKSLVSLNRKAPDYLTQVEGKS